MMRRWPKYLAELIGTFCLVTAGCGAIVVNQLSGGRLGAVGVSLVFGLVVMAMIYTIGHISGAHMNPAVTLGFFAAGRLSSREIFPYIAAQMAGATVASAFLALMFGTQSGLGLTQPAGSSIQSFAMEFVLSFILMLVIMGVATDHRAQGTMAGVAVGGTICFEALLGGPISGASMNPARSFGPALSGLHFDFLWLYFIAPISGCATGVLAYRIIQCHEPNSGKTGCC